MLNERQKEMIRYLADVKFSRVEQLMDKFQVSQETVRRDLMEMEKESSVKRVRGGAVYSSLRAKERAFEKKVESNHKEKHSIVQLAAEHICEGDAIVMNNGATTMALAKQLRNQHKKLTVVTNSPEIALIFKEDETRQIFLVSGYLRKHNTSLIGCLCTDSLSKFQVDKTILSVDGISIQDGITEYNTEEAAVLRKMLEIGSVKMLLSEYSKFNEVAFNRICPARNIDYIFTDWNIPAKEIRLWEEIGVKVLAAK